MNTFRLTISSPDGNKFQDDVVKFDVRGVEGELAIMAGHIPFVTSLVPCDCTIWTDDDTKKEAHTEGGLLTVNGESATLIAGSFTVK